MPTKKYSIICLALLFFAFAPLDREPQKPTNGMFCLIAALVVLILGAAVRRWGNVYIETLMESRYILIALAVALIFFGIPSLGVSSPYGSDWTLFLGVFGVAIPLITGIYKVFVEEKDRRREFRRR